MTSRRVPKLRLHRPTGQAVVTLNGRDRYLGTHGTDQAQARYDALIAEWLASGRNLPPSLGGQKTLTVSDVLLRYWRFAESYYRKGDKPTDELACLRSALRPVRQLFGATPAAEFGPLRLKAVRKAFVDSGWCRSYVNASIRRVKRVFKWAASEELVPPSVFHGLQAVSGLPKGRAGARESDGVMHSVTVEIPMGKGAPTRVLLELEGEFAAALRAAKAGSLHGNEVGSGSWTVFMYGKSADAMFDAIRPVLKACPLSDGATVVKRFGGPNAEERTRVLWRGRFRITQRAQKPGRRPRVGDVLEFDCTGGVGHAQAIHRESKEGMRGLWVLRVFRGVRQAGAVKDAQRELCRTWVALGPCVAQGLMRVVGHNELPFRARLPRLTIVNPAMISSCVEHDRGVDDDDYWQRARS